MSEHTDAARLEATRDAIRTGTAPRPRVETERVRSLAEEHPGHIGLKTIRDLALDLLDARAELARLTAEVERLREIADDALLQAEMFDEHDPTVQSIRARLAALALPTPAPEAKE